MDNTIIYSYKHDIGPDKICAEIYQDREISYITAKTRALLEKVVQSVVMVPTTTRTIEQYNRIDLGVGRFKYVLACNGGVLLVDSEEDADWYNESVRLISASSEEMLKAKDLLESYEDRIFELRYIKELFLFTKCNEPENAVSYLQTRLDESKVDVFNNGVKVYVVPKKLDKGTAIRRLKEKLGAQKVIAAGDSEFDIPMLKAADYGIAPESLGMQAVDSVKCIDDEEIFAEKVLEEVLKVAGA